MCERSIDGCGDVRAAEINGHQWCLSDCKNTLHGAISGLLEGGVDFLCRDALFLDVADKVHDGDVGSRNTEGNAIELTLQLGEDKGNSLGSTSGSGDNVEGGSASTTEIAMRCIKNALITSV